MSVLTTITEGELTHFLKDYNLGSLQSFIGISEGTVNTNYLLKINHVPYILTLFEVLKQETAEAYLSLTELLSQEKIPCATALVDSNKKSIRLLHNKPACLVRFMKGENLLTPSPRDCFQVGTFLARMHQSALHFNTKIANQMDASWRQEKTSHLMQKLSMSDQKLMNQALAIQDKIPWHLLPKSMIHYDFFRDNVFFQQAELSGIIDFYYACYDAMILDIVIAINDWCTNWQAAALPIQAIHLHAMLEGYQTVRQLEMIEKQQILPILRVMSFHFWLARTLSLVEPPKGSHITLKDPEPFKKIYLNWLDYPCLII